MKDFDIKKVNGKWDYSTLNDKKALKRLERELNKRDIPNNIKDFFSKVESRQSYFEESMGRQEIEKMFASLVKSIGVQKVNGAQLIQVSASLLMKGRMKFYEYNGDTVSPAECMVTMTGSFKNLFNLPEMKALVTETTSLLEKTKLLNKLLENPEFVNKHRDKLTVVAYRIPTQGLNSMDAMIIKEFLPPFNEMTIVTPPEITVKSGTDYDYDKMSVLLPNLDEEGNMIKEGIKGSQNRLLETAKNILLDPVNFFRLITPNSDKLIMSVLKGEGGILDRTGKSLQEPTGSDVTSPYTNFVKWNAVKSKNLLGIAALANKFYSLMQAHNWKVNKTYKLSFETQGKGVTIDVKSTVNPVLLSQAHRNKIESDKFDLSYPFNESGVSKQEILSQLINVTVDAPSDDSFGFTNFKLTNLGGAIYLSNTFGYSIQTLMDFFHQPVIFQFMSKVIYYKGRVLAGRKTSEKNAKILALCDIFGIQVDPIPVLIIDKNTGDVLADFEYLATDTETFFSLIGKEIPKDLTTEKKGVVSYTPTTMYRIEAELTEWFNELEKGADPTLLNKDVTKNPKNAPITDQQKAVIAHYYKTLQQAEVTRVANTVLNFDTSIDNNLMKVYDRIEAYMELIDYNLYPKENIDSIKDDSVISSLNTTSVMRGLSARFFPILYSENAIALFRQIGKLNRMTSNKDTVYRKVTNDYLHSIIQNFGTYKGKTITEFAIPYTYGEKKFNIIAKAEELIRQLESEGIQLRLLNILAVDKGKTVTNTKLFQGFENGTDDKNHLTDEFRYLLNRPDTKDFAEALAIVGFAQSGYTKSPIYFSDIIPEEFLTPIMSKAFSDFNKLSEQSQKTYMTKFRDKFLKYEGKAMGLESTAKEAWRFKDYTIAPKEYEEKESPFVSTLASNIYRLLGSKTKFGRVKLVPWKELKDPVFYIKDGNSLVSTRIPNSPVHFGNPFSSDPRVLSKYPKLIKTSSTKESVERYIDWILKGAIAGGKEVEPERRAFILESLKSGNLKNIPILYYTELGEPSHANALDYLINQYDWNSNTQDITIPETVTETQEIQADPFLEYAETLQTKVEPIAPLPNKEDNSKFQNISSENTEDRIASENTIRDLTARMSDRIGISYKIISDKTQKFRGKLENGIAIINLAYATLDTPIHEILGHPIIRAIKNSTNNYFVEANMKAAGYVILDNKGNTIATGFNSIEAANNYINANLKSVNPLYQNLLKELETGIGKEVLNRIKKDYVQKQSKNTYSYKYDDFLGEYKIYKNDKKFIDNYDFNPGFYDINKAELFLNKLREKEVTFYTLEEQQEEAIVELLGMMTAEKLDAVKDGKLISLLKRLLKEIENFIKNLLFQDEIYIENLPESNKADLVNNKLQQLINSGKIRKEC